MRNKALAAYAVLLAGVFLSHIREFRFINYLVPFFLVLSPIVLRGRINFRFRLRDAVLGLLVSLVVLIPFRLFFFGFRPLSLPAAYAVNLLAVAFAEETFFRGYLQDVFGNGAKSMVAVSAMFAAAHLPAFFFEGNIYAFLTFFPSLVMGFLYMKTSNTLPSTIFHFLANISFIGFMV